MHVLKKLNACYSVTVNLVLNGLSCYWVLIGSYAVSIGTTTDNLEWPWLAVSASRDICGSWASCLFCQRFFLFLGQQNIRYLRIISCDIVKRKHTELSIYTNIYLSIFNSGRLGAFCVDYTTVSKFQLNVDNTAMYDIVLLAVFNWSEMILQTTFLFDVLTL